jgi:hypothetical protein
MEFLKHEHKGQEEGSALPMVIVPGGAVTITQSAEQLFAAIAPKKQLFCRGGLGVEIVNDGQSHTVEALHPIAAQSRFEKYVRFVKETKAGGSDQAMVVPTNINEATAKQYLRSEACRTLLPKLNGVLRCSLLVERDGKLHQLKQGYDDATGFFVDSSLVPEVLDVDSAVEVLAGTLQDFDFVTPGDKSRALASILTPALKLGGLIKGLVPVDVAEANASQSGKTYRQRMVAAIYNQKPAVVTKKVGGVGSTEETFGDHLATGKVFIQFDNVRGKLDSQYLESFLTGSGTFPVRVPGLRSMNIDPSQFILFISSNGLETTKDMTNRASIIRIRRRKGYQFKSLGGMDMVQVIFAGQATLIGAVFAVVREWHRQGKPRTEETRHDFREWCQSLDWIVQNIFKEAPLMEGHDAAKARAANPNLSFLRVVALKLNEKKMLGQPISATDIADICIEEYIDIPGLKTEDKTADQAPLQIGKILRPLFKESEELTFEEFKVVRAQEKGKTDTGNAQTLNRYTFSLVTAQSQNP